MNFSIIDFETATPWRGSVCAVGLTVVRNGEIVDSFYSLINPQEHIHTFNTKIHGISDADVATAPTFAEVWPKIVELVGEYPLGAHNAEFDMAAIQSAVVHWDVQPANFKVFDTLSLFRSAFNCSNGCGLDAVAEHYGVSLDHHNAGADATVTAKCVLKLAENIGIKSISALFRTTEQPAPLSILFVSPIFYKKYVDKNVPKPVFTKKTVPTKTPDKDITLTYGNELKDNCICITGELNYCSRNQAKQLIENHGGRMTSSMTRRTNILLVGFYPNQPDGYMSGKHKDALDSIARGNDIKIWREEDFLSIVQNQAADGKDAYDQMLSNKAPETHRAPLDKQPRYIVVQMLDDGTVVGEFPTVTAAAEHVKISQKSIRDAANGYQKHAAGFCWSFVYSEDN